MVNGSRAQAAVVKLSDKIVELAFTRPAKACWGDIHLPFRRMTTLVISMAAETA
jgi:hypothetical protein